MAKRKVIEVNCDRCKRVETLDEVEDFEGPELSITFADKTMSFEDLCCKCKIVVKKALNRVLYPKKSDSPD